MTKQKPLPSKDERGNLPWYHPGSTTESVAISTAGFCHCTLQLSNKSPRFNGRTRRDLAVFNLFGLVSRLPGDIQRGALRGLAATDHRPAPSSLPVAYDTSSSSPGPFPLTPPARRLYTTQIVIGLYHALTVASTAMPTADPAQMILDFHTDLQNWPTKYLTRKKKSL
jgi:hypothetical protein